MRLPGLWLRSGIECQLLPLIGWVLCLEMLINVSVSSETSAVESAGLRSHSDFFLDYANKTPLKLSYSIQVIIMHENEWDNYWKTVYVFVYVCLCERGWDGDREKHRFWALCVIWEKNLLRVLDWLPRVHWRLHAAKFEMLSFFLWHHISIILSR